MQQKIKLFFFKGKEVKKCIDAYCLFAEHASFMALGNFSKLGINIIGEFHILEIAN